MASLFGGTGAKQAAQAQQEATAAAERARVAQENMQKNMAMDLKTENVGQVVAGGTADVASAAADTLKKKKSVAGGLASSLGINV